MGFVNEQLMNGEPLPVLGLEAWRCQQCDKLIHNTDKDGYPAPGAPQPKYGCLGFDKICTMCFGMLRAIDNSIYWKALHDKGRRDREQQNKNRDKMRPGEDYFK